MRHYRAQLGCSPSGNCRCGGSCGACRGATSRQDTAEGLAGVKAIERVLTQYALDKMKRGEPFYITDQLNSNVLQRADRGLGIFFLLPLLAAAASAAGPVMTAVSAASTVRGLVGASAASGVHAATDADVAARVQADLAAQGINLPDGLANQVTYAGMTSGNIMMLLALAGGLLLVVAMK